MLPDPEHLWLTDAQGNRYTSELRLTAVDLTHPNSSIKAHPAHHAADD
jgi:hypothetical protein